MDVEKAYDSWAEQYDTNVNRTRDLEAIALQTTLTPFRFNSCLELGCGTGKNTGFLSQHVQKLVAVDFSDEMLARAKTKVNSPQVTFVKANIVEPWTFGEARYDLITFSLVLEHVKNLENVFQNAAKAILPGGMVYIGELHPYKQYDGAKARFDTEAGQQSPDCYTHNISDFVSAAEKHGFQLSTLNEYFDDDARTGIPRILTIVLRCV
jgi:ubiquinone/menaquinone biosynthesis C-methylase UbiE